MADRLAGRHEQIHTARDKKLETARDRRKLARQTITPIHNQPQPLTTPAVA
ncbi:MAG: hypothetical protein KA004_17560 [Verrucomicrobiales bacterium]|nr:hypothetical protein [Verrucomicrobiales bacterium]